ncbi:hypothetical protein TNCV_2510791 [Trichonephila clavipes]|nr:hypothetical protein TNCV_2510791 [Trichonephila clavipes]
MFKETGSAKYLPTSDRPSVSEATVEHVQQSFQLSPIKSNCEASNHVYSQHNAYHPTPSSDRGSLVVRVKDSWLTCHEFKPFTTEDPPLHVKYVEAQTSARWCGVEVRRRGASSGVVFVTWPWFKITRFTVDNGLKHLFLFHLQFAKEKKQQKLEFKARQNRLENKECRIVQKHGKCSDDLRKYKN